MGYSPWVTKSWTRLSDAHFDFQCEVYEGEGHLMTGTVWGYQAAVQAGWCALWAGLMVSGMTVHSLVLMVRLESQRQRMAVF